VVGVIDQVEAIESGRGVWLRQADGQPVLVVGEAVPEGLRHRQSVRVLGVPGSDLIGRGRDGLQRQYTVVEAIEVQLLPPGGPGTWVFWPLLAVLAAVAAVVVVAARRGGHGVRERRGRGTTDQAWEALEPADLPEDPAEALAVLAQRADEEQA
jgi:hypothetical protein